MSPGQGAMGSHLGPAGRPLEPRAPAHTIRRRVRGFVAPTDHGWYQFLRARPEIDEVNFWRPGATAFSALRPGEVFFFKLKAPYNAIGGFGLFARFAPLPVWRAWDIFAQANGAADEHELLDRLGRLSAARIPMSMDRVIGCIAITQPVFFAPDDWIPPPTNWARTTPITALARSQTSARCRSSRPRTSGPGRSAAAMRFPTVCRCAVTSTGFSTLGS